VIMVSYKGALTRWNRRMIDSGFRIRAL